MHTIDSIPDKKTALILSQVTGAQIYELFASANRVRDKKRGNRVDLCSIINAKSGACPEDCSFCAQSAHNKSKVNVYPLLKREEIIKAARSAKEHGVKRFCIVTSGKKPSKKELKEISRFISEIRDLGLLPCATLGMLEKDELMQLKDAGLNRYHHNLETSETFFSEICSSHTYKDKIRTIEGAISLGFSLCSGGIFGLGESWEDRIDLAFALKDLGVDSIPINFYTPYTASTESREYALGPMEALTIIALFRLVLPECQVRVCGGRPQTLRDFGSQIFLAGADALLIGNYLTTSGRNPADDLQMIQDAGLEI